MSDAARTVVVGGSIASLVAADELVHRGRFVTLYLPEQGVGGGFVPAQIGERRLDLGARVIELSYDDEPDATPALAEYRPGPHGHRQYLSLITELVLGLVGDDLELLHPPQVSVDRRRCTDYVLGGDLTGLVEVLDGSELADMAHEASICVHREGPHGVFTPHRASERFNRSFGEVGRSHTGTAFHDRLIESLASKMIPGGTDAVIAGLHRKIWLPLFHPLTAWEACVGELTYRPTRAMHTVAGGGMGEVVARLFTRATSSPLLEVRHAGALVGLDGEPGAHTATIAFEDGTAEQTSEPILGVGAGELFGAAGIPFHLERVLASMVWVDVDAKDIDELPSVLFISEPDLPVFRVTESRADALPGRHTLCCEIDPRAAKRPNLFSEVVRALRETKVITRAAEPTMVSAASQPAFPAPSFENRALFETARNALADRHLGAVVVGAALEFGADTFNEQVIQGLAAASRCSSA